jgi:hypothetical protein
MLSMVTLIGVAAGLVAFFLSAVSLGLHWLNHGKHPDVTALQSRMDAFQMAQVEMLDRIEHWTRRDRVRRVRDGAVDAMEAGQSPLPITKEQLKSSLREQLARGRA